MSYVTQNRPIQTPSKDGPCSFDNQMLVLKRWQRGMSAANVALDRVSLWVQIWGAPFDMVSPQITTNIGGRIGMVEEVEKQRSNDSQSLFMRVRVSVSVSKPLRRGCFVSDSDGNCTWLNVKYERLGMFCYFCGFVGHNLKHCAGFFVAEKNGETMDLQYGDWLKAVGGWQKQQQGLRESR